MDFRVRETCFKSQSNAYLLFDLGQATLPLTLRVFICKESSAWASQVVQLVKNPPASGGDIRSMDSIPELGKSREGRHGNPLQYSWTEEPGGLQSVGSQRVRHD